MVEKKKTDNIHRKIEINQINSCIKNDMSTSFKMPELKIENLKEDNIESFSLPENLLYSQNSSLKTLFKYN